MKKTVIILLTLFTVFITSCGSTKIKPVREPDETYLADIDTFELGNVNCLTAFGKSKAKVTDIYFLINPRTNELILRFRLGIDLMELVYTYSERENIDNTFTTYLEDIQNPKLPNIKPNKKNSYLLVRDGYVGWGLTTIGHTVYNAEYFTNYEFLEPNKPYFKIQYYSAEEKDKKDVLSPYFAIYLTPAQIRKIREICNQNRIQEEVDKVLKEAYTFDDFEYSYSDSEEDEPAYIFDDDESYIDAK